MEISSSGSLSLAIDDTHTLEVLKDPKAYLTLNLLISGQVVLSAAISQSDAAKFQRMLAALNVSRNAEIAS